MRILATVAVGLLLLAGCTSGPISPKQAAPQTASPSPVPVATEAAYPEPLAITGDTGTHDPTVVRRGKGYLLAQTGDNLVLKTSRDGKEWRDEGAAFPEGAPWTSKYTAGSASLWAPDLSFHDGRYFLYYSASSFGSRNSAIFLATSTTGAPGTWKNNGKVISTTDDDTYNAIDPNLFVDDDGRWRLVFGSFWTGIKMIELDPATGLRDGTALLSIAQRAVDDPDTSIEAPFIVKRGTYYYLWVSFDLCCKGADSTYRIMVGRSEEITGPYVDRTGKPMTEGGGTEVLAGHGSIHGPGHEAVLDDTLYYHYYDDAGTPRLGINPLTYDADAWPSVTAGGQKAAP